MKSRRAIRLGFKISCLSLLVAAAPLGAIDLNPTHPLKYQNRNGEIQELVFDYDDEHVWTIQLPPGGSYTSGGARSLTITPKAPQSQIRVSLVPLDKLPPGFETKEELALYASIVKQNIPKDATEPGPLKRAGGFISEDGKPSDAYGLVYGFGGRKFAIGCGFGNHPDLNVQVRYVVNAPVENFEELHRYIRYELSGFRKMTMEQIKAMEGTQLQE